MISFDINNKGYLTVHQDEHDSALEIFSTNTGTFYIEAGDFITMLNWYRYQKENGNETLDY